MSLVDWIGIGFSVAALALSIVSIVFSISGEKRNIRVTLFEKRYALYTQLKELTRGLVSRDQNVRDDALSRFVDIRDQVVFLFDKDIHDYVLLIIKNFEEMNRYFSEERKDERYNQLWGWFMNQVADKKEMRLVFRKYLDLGSYGLLKKKNGNKPKGK